MSKIKNGALDRYGAGLFERQQFGTAGIEGVKIFEKRRVVGRLKEDVWYTRPCLHHFHFPYLNSIT